MASSERMSVFINDILNFSKLTHSDASFVSTNLNQILQHVLSDLELEIDNNQVRIEAGSLPQIEAIPIQMNQLFFNLIGNSLKFARPDIPLIIRIEAKEIDEERKKSFPSLDPSILYTELLFIDNGMGFDQQYAEKIFTIFQRLNNRSYKGSGIGLALCRRIVQYHRGEIFAISTEGEGTSFHVILPVKQRN
jgi:two-component system CheB/CheR fusion protein